MEHIYYHIDVNSAFLSWEAAYRVRILGETNDLRDIPSVVGGSQETRHGIVLAKSVPCKPFKIKTGEPLVDAIRKCPTLTIVPPNFDLYVNASNAFQKLLEKYCPIVEQYSIDEFFCDMTGTTSLYGKPVIFAHELKDIVKKELGFTVNIGVSNNKLLAKMASDFQKPDKVHTLFPEEIPDKMWPLPVGDLFFVGKRTEKQLHSLGIKTIGQLANTDIGILKSHFKSHGEVIWKHANGLELCIDTRNNPVNKGYGNSLTTHKDVTASPLAKQYLLSLTETVCARIRTDKVKVKVVAVTITDNDFNRTSRQTTLSVPTDITETIYGTACRLFDELWDGHPIRQLGVNTSHAKEEEHEQLTLFGQEQNDKLSRLNKTIDNIRTQYGDDAVFRASFLNSPVRNMEGGHGKH